MRSPNGVNDSPYDAEYKRRRKILLAGNPMCHWGCGRRATTADHVPPVAQAGKHYNLVPACEPCNKGHVQSPLYPPLFREW